MSSDYDLCDDDFIHQLRRIVSINLGKVRSSHSFQVARPRKRIGKRIERWLEFQAWNIYFTFLNSPYVVSAKNFFTWTSLGNSMEPDNSFKIWNDVMIKAFELRACGMHEQGQKLEDILDQLKSKSVEPGILRLLLSLAWSGESSLPDNSLLQRSHYSLAWFQHRTDVNERQTHNLIFNRINWMKDNTGLNSGSNEGFFPQIPEDYHSIFSEKPGTHLAKRGSIFAWQGEKEDIEVTKKEGTLFGALSQSHMTSLEMTLEIPMLSQNPLSLTTGTARKVQELSEDEGFIDDITDATPSIKHSQYDEQDTSFTNLDIWTKALRCNETRLYNWEKLCGTYEVSQDLPFLTESGPNAFNHLYDLRHFEVTRLVPNQLQMLYHSQDDVIRDSVNVLIGLPSNTFIFDKAKCTFSVAHRLRMTGISPEALQSLLGNFADVGSYYRQLNRFIDHHSEHLHVVSGGQTLEAFMNSLKMYMDTYKCVVIKLQEFQDMTLFKLSGVSQRIGMQLRSLADVCLCSIAFRREKNKPKPRFPVGLRLLSYLYELCRKNRSTINYKVLLQLFIDAASPFLRYINDWIFKGCCRDPYAEYFIDVDDQYLCCRDKHYWTHGFKEKQNRMDASFMVEGIFEKIFSCGKTINLLKATYPEHYLLKHNLDPPNMAIKLSMKELEDVRQESKDYTARVLMAYEEENEKRFILIANEHDLKREKIAVERAAIKTALENANNLERQVKQAIQHKKHNELQFLKHQMEQAIEERERAKKEQKEKDMEFIRKAEQLDIEKAERLKEERERLLRYYEQLSEQALKRENRALWYVRRFDLRNRRKKFLDDDKEKIANQMLEHPNAYSETTDDVITMGNERSGTQEEMQQENDPRIASKDSAFDMMIEDFKKGLEHNEANDTFPDVSAKQQIHNKEDNQQRTKEDASTKRSTNNDQSSSNENKIHENASLIQKEATQDGMKSSDSQNNLNGIKMKSLLYPNLDSHLTEVRSKPANQEALWDIKPVASEKKESTLQSILYPGNHANELAKSITYTRGREPESKSKQLIYFGRDEAMIEDKIETPRQLTDEEVWIDISTEPLQDNFDVMNSMPNPYLSNVLHVTGVSDRRQEEVDAVDHLPIEMILERSLMIPLKAQISVVQDAIVKYFIEDLHIGVHFDAFRKFLLLEDGEFGRSLCNQIFEKAFSGLHPREFCIPTVLNNMITRALQLSIFADQLTFSRQLTFSLKWIPDVLKSTDIAALDFLELRYKVPWPCNIVVTENCITKYNKVFSLMLRLKKVSWTLQLIWTNLKTAGHNRRAAMSPQLRMLQLFRHEMLHFVNNIERYFVNQIIFISWQEFQHDLSHNVHNLDDLHKVHVNYLNKIIFRSLLSKNASAVFKIISDIFSLILKVHLQLLSSPWKVDDVTGFVTHDAFNSICVTHKAFQEYAGFLFKVVSKLVRRGYQHHLDDLLLQVNFNNYYEHVFI